MIIWLGPVYKKIADSELGAGHTSGIVPAQKTQSFFGVPLSDTSHLIKTIVIEFWCDKRIQIIKTHVNYFKSDTHKHIHLTGNIMPAYKKEGASKGDVLLFWKSKEDQTMFKVELVKQNTPRWNEIKDNFKHVGGKLSFNPPGMVENEYIENVYQEESIVDPTLNDNDFPPVKRTQLRKTTIKSSPKRSKAKGDYVIKKNGFKCEINVNHITFISKSNNLYMEKHHLIPMEFYEKFDYSLDDIGNIVSLCPNCHRMIHNGKKENVAPIIRRLWELKINKLKEAHIEIELKDLEDMYFN